MNAASFLLGLARISAQAGVLVLLVLLVQWLFRNQLAPRWRCALWFLVMARLALPTLPDSATSIFNLLPQWETRTGAAPISEPAPVVPPPSPRLQQQPSTAATPAQPPSTADHRSVASPVAGESIRPDAGQPNPAPNDFASNAAKPTTRPAPLRRLDILFWTWLAGALALGAYTGVGCIRLARSCRGRPVVLDAPLQSIRDDCLRRLGLRRQVPILESAAIPSPALFGIFSPRLLLPKGFISKFTETELRYVFLHEFAHLKRRDLLCNWLVTALQILHWFNPLVWVGFARWRSDRELACDALALEAAGADHGRDYGQTVLHLLEDLTPLSPSPGLVGIVENKRQLRRRMALIASYRPGRRFGWVAAGVMAVSVVVGLTEAQSPKSRPATVASGRVTEKPKERVGADPVPELLAQGEEPVSLMVTVLSPEGKRLPGAEVFTPYIQQAGLAGVRRLTDASGHYVIRFKSPPNSLRQRINNFLVTVRAPGLVHKSVMWSSSGGDVYAGMPDQVTLTLERGRDVGGVVQDAQGRPLAGVRVLLSSSGYRWSASGTNERKTQEYSECSFTDPDAPAAVSDKSGRWSFAAFPKDAGKVEVSFVRPDGARDSFSTQAGNALNQRPIVSLAELTARTLVTRLQDGLTVRGIAVDEAGRPLRGVTVRDGYGHNNIVRGAGLTTGLDGRFEFQHRAPREWIYTASRADRATASVVAPVEPGMAEVRIVLPPAQPARLRVVDVQGKPVADAELSLDLYRTEAQILDWSGRSDAQGRVVWTNAPLVPVTFYVRSETTYANRKVRLIGGEAEQQITLSEAAVERISVRGKAVDAGTKQPLPLISVGARFLEGEPFKSLPAPSGIGFAVELERSDVPSGSYPSYQLRLEAAGHEAFLTPFLDFDLGDQNLEPALSVATGASEVKLLQPDGQPAAGARLWIHSAEHDSPLIINGPGRFYGDRLIKRQADDQGRVQWPGVAADLPVIIAHSNGFWRGPMAKARANTELQLEPFGTVDGLLRIAGQPKAGVTLSLTTPDSSLSSGVHLSYTATTGTDGKFHFSQVPAGSYKLYRWALPPRHAHESGITITETHQAWLTVAPGQSNWVEYASAGRTIVGQVATEPRDATVDWLNDVHLLSLKLPASRASARPNREDYATFAAFLKAERAARNTANVEVNSQAGRTYAVEFESDGSFRIDDIPPGTYELQIRVTRWDNDRRRASAGQAEVLGALTREVAVPEGAGPLDLGGLSMAIREFTEHAGATPVAFRAATLDGKTVTAADLKGRPALFVFWTSWSDRSLEQLMELQRLQRELGEAPPLTIVGVSLDETAEAARAVVKAQGYNWTQCWLDAPQRARLTADFDVKTLPAVFLMDREGRLIAKELEGERLPRTVKRTLAGN